MLKRTMTVMSLCLLMLGLVAAGPCAKNSPYNATGSYEGVWQQAGGPGCTMSADLSMQSGMKDPPYLWNGNGYFYFDLDCVEWPEELPPLADITGWLPGVLDEYGNLSFGAIECGTPYCTTFSVNGHGLDTDADGFMDTYAGGWDLAFALAGFEPFGIGGSFSLERVDDETIATDELTLFPDERFAGSAWTDSTTWSPPADLDIEDVDLEQDLRPFE